MRTPVTRMLTPKYCIPVTTSPSQPTAMRTTMRRLRLPSTLSCKGPIIFTAKHCETLRHAAARLEPKRARIPTASAVEQACRNLWTSVKRAMGARSKKPQKVLQKTRLMGVMFCWRHSCCSTPFSDLKNVAKVDSNKARTVADFSPVIHMKLPIHTTTRGRRACIVSEARPIAIWRKKVMAGVLQPIMATKATPPNIRAELFKSNAAPTTTAIGKTRRASDIFGFASNPLARAVTSMWREVIEYGCMKPCCSAVRTSVFMALKLARYKATMAKALKPFCQSTGLMPKAMRQQRA
mmetsp:Transcript_87109/g.154147  ORF Transcript_87109/g.154147 Transcript_87109/m.154147 type:complete len:294 (+) Transcript_87109:193-1074(+)